MRDFFDNFAKMFGYDFWDWGVAAEWIGAIGTAGALILGMVILGNDRRTRAQKHADTVKSRATWEWNSDSNKTWVRSEIHNTGDWEVREVYFLVVGRRKKGRRLRRSYHRLSPMAVKAGGKVHSKFSFEGLELGMRVYLVFNDVDGVRWIRDAFSRKYVSSVRASRLIYATYQVEDSE